MMKSFFKKLAFVMALAMVVSMAAPAGTAAFAADFYIADEANKKAETYKLAVGEKEDFSFKNAPDWKDYSWTWKSSNDKVLTVDKNGLATGVADGVATITLTGVKNNVVAYTAKSVVTVGKGEALVEGYEVVQTTNEVIEVRFEGKNAYKINDVTLYYLLENEGEFEDVEWPIDYAKCKVLEDGTFSIKPYVPFEDGNSYRIHLNAKDAGTTFTTEFGLPDRVDLSKYSSNDVKQKAFAVNDEKDDVVTKFDVRLFSGDVDVTALYLPEYNPNSSMEFEVFWTDATDALTVDVDSNTGDITFQETGVSATIKAEFTYSDGTDEAFAEGWSDEITAEALPAYKLKTVYKWTIVEDTDPKTEINWNKVDHDIAAYDEDKLRKDYKIVALISDSYGNYIVTDSRYEDTDANIYAWDNSEYTFANKNYELAFESANVEKLLVETEGKLTTYTKANVPVLVALVDENETSRYIGAVKVQINEARYIAKIVPDVTKVNVVTDAIKDGSGAKDASFYTQYIPVKVYDQHGDLWVDNLNISIKANQNNADIINGIGKYVDSNSNKVLEAGELKTDAATAANSIAYKAADGKATLTIDGNQLFNSIKKSNVTYTLSVKDEAANVTKTCQVKVNFKTVAYYPTGGVNAGEVKPVEKGTLSATGINQTVAADDKIPVQNKIVFAKTSNSQIVGYDESVDEILTAGETVDLATATIGDVYLKVVNKATKALVPASTTLGTRTATKADGTITTVTDRTKGIYEEKAGLYHVVGAGFTEVGSDDIDYLDTGVYVVTVEKIKSIDKVAKTVEWTKISETSFTITNDNSEVAFVGVLKDVAESASASDIIVKNLDFTLGGKDWAFTASDIVSCTYRTNTTSGYVIITSVTFRVPLNGKFGDTATDKGYLKTVTVNKAIELPEGEGFDYDLSR